MELNTLIKALLAIISQCSVKDATLPVIKFQSLYLMVKVKSWRNVHFGHLGEMSIGEMSVGVMSIGEMSGYHLKYIARWFNHTNLTSPGRLFSHISINPFINALHNKYNSWQWTI